eukprot:TRINITY_DN3658_c0_g1_i1.p1 TRINITY_DN3658_c0_g1~~TRINITY_DN3658_c0_g1_i1.p1  ORF type:complete len:184 (+),score=32.35 TRINITY_DN3658_c0_g1_i1:82-633(+)
MRSSQPMTGMGGLGGFVSTSWWSQNRCVEDESLLFDAKIKYIIDARPKMNAVVNQAAGGGYENTVDFYKGIKLIYGGIHNIHEVRKSFDNIIKAIHQSVNRHNHALRIPHIKYLYIGHKHHHKTTNHDQDDDDDDDDEWKQDEEDEEDDFGVIASNQPYNIDLIEGNKTKKKKVTELDVGPLV